VRSLSDVTLGDIVKGLNRYRPFLLTVLAVLLIAVILPGRHDSANKLASGGTYASGQAAPGTSAANTPAAVGSTDAAAATNGSTSAASSGANVLGNTISRDSTSGGTASAASQAPAFKNSTGQMGPDCDPATGRVKVPSLYAFPCVPAFSGSNGGATYQGVSADSITVAYYQPQDDPSTKAILVAGGDTDSADTVAQQYVEYANIFNHHTQLYGRKVKVVIVPGSGNATDDAAAKADAIKVEKDVKAFMSWGAPGGTTAYVNELTAHGVECVCTTTLPKDFYEQHAPYVWGNGLPDENQAYIMRAEYIGKRLQGRPAKWAGDPTLAVKPRKFGLIYYETTDHAYAAGEKFFEEELAKYGVKLADKYSYIFDTPSAQQTSDTIMSKFASEGITSVIFVGDPIYPVFYTNAATKQNYHPEWVVTGSALTDTSFFGRTYDKTQWNHAFGISLLAARGPKTETDAYRIVQWQLHKDPVAPGTYTTVYPTVFLSFLGFQMAGPTLNPATFKLGMFSYPVSPSKPGITNPAASWGRHGWPWDDYNLYDDATELWWDNTATGPDELGNNGTGLYEYVAGGKRFGPGQQPTTDPAAFDKNGAVTIYNSLPPADKYPTYPEKDYF